MTIEAYFIFKKENNKIVGNHFGYFTKEAAVDDFKLHYFRDLNIPYFLVNKPTNEQSIYYTKLKTKLDKWKFDFDKWTEHIFNPFFESNYKVIKREFKIVFTDDL